MAAVQPQDFARRSFIYRRLADHGAVFREHDGAAVAERYGEADDEITRARRLGLADLSTLERTGFKGRGALDWLRAQGVTGLETDNRAGIQPDGTLAARLAPTEAVILGDLAGASGLCACLNDAWSLESAPGCYRVARREASFHFVLTGSETAAMMAKVCGVDLRHDRFAEDAIAQTSVARTNVIVIRRDAGATPAFQLLGDSASAGFFWDSLLDAMAEFDGGPVGLAALEALTAEN